MEQSKGKIGIREYVSIVILAIGTKLSDDTPAILFENLENATWIAPIITGVISILPIYLLLKVYSKFPNKNLMDILQSILGKRIGYFFVFSLWALGSYAIIVDTAIYADIIGTMYFTQTPTIIIYLVLMTVSAYGAKKGLEQIGSVAWAVIGYIKASLLIALIFSMSQGQFNYLFPIFGPGKWEIVKESSFKLSIYADFLFFGVFASYVSSTKAFKKGTWIALGILILEMSLSIIAYVMLFDYKSVKMLNYPFHEIIRYISIGFITNIETFFFPFWLIATFIRFSIYLYISGTMFGWLFKIQNFEYTIPSLATLFLFLGMIPETPTFTIFNLRGNMLNIISPMFFSLPCLLWLVAKLKGVFKNDQNCK